MWWGNCQWSRRQWASRGRGLPSSLPPLLSITPGQIHFELSSFHLVSGSPRSTRCLPSRRRGRGWLLKENSPRKASQSELRNIFCKYSNIQRRKTSLDQPDVSDIYVLFMQIKVPTTTPCFWEMCNEDDKIRGNFCNWKYTIDTFDVQDNPTFAKYNSSFGGKLKWRSYYLQSSVESVRFSIQPQ